jgi:hypothetical protein
MGEKVLDFPAAEWFDFAATLQDIPAMRTGTTGGRKGASLRQLE